MRRAELSWVFVLLTGMGLVAGCLAKLPALTQSVELPSTTAVLPTPSPEIIYVYRPTDWPTDVSPLVDCERQEDTGEACLGGYKVRLVGYLLRPGPGRADFILLRGPLRAPVHVILPEGYSRDSLDKLCERRALAVLEGDVTSLDPPTLMVLHESEAAKPFRPTLPLTEVYTDTRLGIKINYPAGWAAEPGTGTDTSAIYLQNFHNADVFEPLAEADPSLYQDIHNADVFKLLVRGDPSLYRVRLYPLPREHVITLEEARAGFGPVAREQRFEVNGLPALRLEPAAWWSVMRAAVLVQLPERVLMLSTDQDPALFDRMVETLRLLE
nr:hypothetical protein [Anaerolineae bacterium]